MRKQAAMTLHRLQTLMRLQADSIAVKNASYQKSMEQEVTHVFFLKKNFFLKTYVILCPAGEDLCSGRAAEAAGDAGAPPDAV